MEAKITPLFLYKTMTCHHALPVSPWPHSQFLVFITYNLYFDFLPPAHPYYNLLLTKFSIYINIISRLYFIIRTYVHQLAADDTTQEVPTN